MENIDKDDIIQQILNIEESAGKITLQMEEDKRKLPEMIAEKEKAIKAEMEKKTKEDIDKLRAKAFDESTAKLSAISISTQKMFAALEIEYENNSDIWREEIFNKIIGR